MKNINLSALPKDLDGNDVAGKTLGQILAIVIISQPKGDPIKFWAWAKILQKNIILEINSEEWDGLKTWVKNCDQLNVSAKAQILDVLYNAPDAPVVIENASQAAN